MDVWIAQYAHLVVISVIIVRRILEILAKNVKAKYVFLMLPLLAPSVTPVLNTGLSLSELLQLYKGYNAI